MEKLAPGSPDTSPILDPPFPPLQGQAGPSLRRLLVSWSPEAAVPKAAQQPSLLAQERGGGLTTVEQGAGAWGSSSTAPQSVSWTRDLSAVLCRL